MSYLRGGQEVGRVFCPQCGNAALDKVEVVISEDGQEQFGVRKRHILRGTRFSLPKPAVRMLGASRRRSLCRLEQVHKASARSHCEECE